MSDFRQRPTAKVALQTWLDMKAGLDISIARWRLRKRNEFVGLRVMRDAVSVVQQSLDNVTRVFNPQASILLPLAPPCDDAQLVSQ
jgi:hypothetical protein